MSNSSCRAEFCWMCLGSWDRHGSSWYKCNRYDEKDSKEARSAQQKSRAALERYLFYCNRYLTHNKSNKLESKLYAMIEYKRHDLEKLDIPQVEVSKQIIYLHSDSLILFFLVLNLVSNLFQVVYSHILLFLMLFLFTSHSFSKLLWIRYPPVEKH